MLTSMFLSFCNFAQQEMHCATDQIMAKHYALHPELKPRTKPFDLSKLSAQKSVNSSYTIPLVIHVLHISGQENISDAQVKDAVRILNRDFAKQNPDTALIIPEFKALADSTKIQFSLATIDPLGNCTNGIIHHYDTDTDWNDSSPTLYQHTWDPTKYMNVYVVKSITLSNGFSAAGYTYFPGTFPAGDPADAIVVLHNYFGSVGTGNYFLSRVLTHEVGHWLSLAHVFGYNNSAATNCFGDDFVSDTPTTQGFLSCPDPLDPSSYQICNPGVSENFQNYMDYSYCNKMFTQEQALNMQFTLLDPTSGRDNLNTNTNLISTGVINPQTTCVPIADFKSNRLKTCINTPVIFYDASNNGVATVFNWSFPGGVPATSTFSAPIVVYNTPGIYSVTYSSANSAGTSSPISKTNLITVTTGTAAYITNFNDGFETAALPNNNWGVINSSGGANWEQSFDAAYSGSFSAKLPSVNNTRRSIASMISPIIDLSNVTTAQLTFKLAAAEVNLNHVNNLKVLASTDCEVTWLQIYSKSGLGLITTSAAANPFYPVFADWRSETVNLSAIGGSPNVRFKFMYTRDTIGGAMNVYVDNINISGSTGINNETRDNSLNFFPNPAHDFFTISNENQLITKILISDLFGGIVELIEATETAQKNMVINCGNNTKLKTGMYFITVLNGYSVFTKKLVVE